MRSPTHRSSEVEPARVCRRAPSLRECFSRRWLRVDRHGGLWAARGPRWFDWLHRRRVAGVLIVLAYAAGRFSA